MPPPTSEIVNSSTTNNKCSIDGPAVARRSEAERINVRVMHAVARLTRFMRFTRQREAPKELLETALSNCGFPIAHYRQAFADLSGMTDAEAAEHFVQHGSREGRFVSMSLQPHGVLALREVLGKESLFLGQVLSALFTSHLRAQPHLLDGSEAAIQAVVALVRPFGGVPVMVFGDSHAVIYAVGKEVRGSQWLLPIDLRTIGASARGLGRDASSSGNGHRIRQFLETHLRKGDPLTPMLFAFGQVDLEFVLPYSAIKKQGLNTLPADYVEEFVGRTVEYYVAFLCSVVPEAVRDSAIVASVLPPTLSDNHWAEGYISALIGLENDPDLTARLRGFSIPPIAERAEMHRAFNARLKQVANAAGFRFLDAFSAFAGTNGCVDPRFAVISGGREHHLDQSPATFDSANTLLWSAIAA